jgi:hypothetical protein
MYKRCDGAEEWAADLQQSTNFQRLSYGIPPQIIKSAIKRAADESLAQDEREPRAIANEMARQELILEGLDLTEQDAGTLEKYRTKGNA